MLNTVASHIHKAGKTKCDIVISDSPLLNHPTSIEWGEARRLSHIPFDGNLDSNTPHQKKAGIFRPLFSPAQTNESLFHVNFSHSRYQHIINEVSRFKTVKIHDSTIVMVPSRH